MTLSQLIQHLQLLADRGHGGLLVYTWHSASGVTSEVSYPFLDAVIGDEDGPVGDLPVGKQYIRISIVS